MQMFTLSLHVWHSLSVHYFGYWSIIFAHSLVFFLKSFRVNKTTTIDVTTGINIKQYMQKNVFKRWILLQSFLKLSSLKKPNENSCWTCLVFLLIISIDATRYWLNILLPQACFNILGVIVPLQSNSKSQLEHFSDKLIQEKNRSESWKAEEHLSSGCVGCY